MTLSPLHPLVLTTTCGLPVYSYVYSPQTQLPLGIMCYCQKEKGDVSKCARFYAVFEIVAFEIPQLCCVVPFLLHVRQVYLYMNEVRAIDL